MIITGKKFSKPAMSRVKNGDIILPEEEKVEKIRLDHLLVKKYPEYNRGTLQNFIKSGYVTVNGKVITRPNWTLENVVSSDARNSDEELRDNERFERLEENNVSIVLAVPEKNLKKTLKPIYEDENVLVINKPAGLLSMAKGEFTEETTLEDYGLLVHRLDRGTSGVVILAKNTETQSMLRRQFQERKTHKTYYAVVAGHPKLNEAMIDLPIARNLKHPTTFQVDPNGKPAQTRYKVIKQSEKHSLIELKPITGRTHQLRVHLAYIGCPILGDPVYSKTKADRLYLHATALEITIPGAPNNQRKIFEAALPEDFYNVL